MTACRWFPFSHMYLGAGIFGVERIHGAIHILPLLADGIVVIKISSWRALASLSECKVTPTLYMVTLRGSWLLAISIAAYVRSEWLANHLPMAMQDCGTMSLPSRRAIATNRQHRIHHAVAVY